MEEKKENIENIIADCKKILKICQELDEEMDSMKESVDFLINEYKTNKKHFREEPGGVTSNQRFEISGDYSQLKLALDFALKFEEADLSHMCYQITEDGKYCIGLALEGEPEEGWKNFDFDFDTEIVAKIIVQTLNKFKAEKSEYELADGSTGKGFIMKTIPDYVSEEWEGIKHPFYGTIYFEPYTNFYDK